MRADVDASVSIDEEMIRHFTLRLEHWRENIPVDKDSHTRLGILRYGATPRLARFIAFAHGFRRYFFFFFLR